MTTLVNASYPKCAWLPEPIHVSLPMNPRLMCWPEANIYFVHMLSYA